MKKITRRSFIKKSTAAGIAAANVSVFSGLINAAVGGGSGYYSGAIGKVKARTYYIKLYIKNYGGGGVATEWTTNPAHAYKHSNDNDSGERPVVSAAPPARPTANVGGASTAKIKLNKIAETSVTGGNLLTGYPKLDPALIPNPKKTFDTEMHSEDSSRRAHYVEIQVNHLWKYQNEKQVP